MKPKKKKILDQAIILFNEKGFSMVSMQMIADRVGMSKGNLAYHFANTKVMLGHIHQMMKAEMDEVIKPAGFIGLAHFSKSLEFFYAFQNKYKFFFLDLVEISRRYPEIAEQHAAIVKQRKEEGRALFNYFIGSGWIIPEPEPGRYDTLSHTIWMINTFWLSQARIFTPDNQEHNPENAIALVWNLIKPYLTEEGIKSI